MLQDCDHQQQHWAKESLSRGGKWLWGQGRGLGTGKWLWREGKGLGTQKWLWGHRNGFQETEISPRGAAAAVPLAAQTLTLLLHSSRVGGTRAGAECPLPVPRRGQVCAALPATVTTSTARKLHSE